MSMIGECISSATIVELVDHPNRYRSYDLERCCRNKVPASILICEIRTQQKQGYVNDRKNYGGHYRENYGRNYMKNYGCDYMKNWELVYEEIDGANKSCPRKKRISLKVMIGEITYQK